MSHIGESTTTRQTRAQLPNRYDVITTEKCYHYDITNLQNRDVQISNYPKWDQMSMDSGFCSDLERKVAQLSVSGSELSSVDDTNDVRAPCRAKLTSEEKRKRNRIRTLPTPGRSTRWHPRDEDIDDLSDGNDDVITSSYRSYPSRHHSNDGLRKSKTLPIRNEKKQDNINWDDITLDDVKQVRVLGGGGYARVDLVELKRYPGRKLALKKMNKKLLQERDQVGHVISEKEAMKNARSNFIPRLFRTFQTPNHVFMLTEACLGGDLFSVLEHHGALHHEAMRYVIASVIEALDHLHRVLNVIHRDVKTENILIDSNGNAKLADLGFCKRLPPNCDVTYTFCGTPGYVAPEVLLRNGHGRTCDFFSTGVVLFEGATCRSPFRRHSNIETHRATLRGIKEVAFPPFLSHVAIQMIRAFCCSDPNQRLGIGGCEQVRRHEYFSGFDWHRLRQGKMTSPLPGVMSRSTDHQPPIVVKDDYHEKIGAVIKSAYDVTWNENF